MRVAAFQFDVQLGEPSSNLATVEAGLRTAAQQGYKLVVLPEMWPTSFVASAGEALANAVRSSHQAVTRVAELSEELDLVVCGTAYADAGPDRAPYNRLHVLDRGRQVLCYDKVHLFSPTAEDQSFLAGQEAPKTIDTSLGSMSGVICYDLRFGDITRIPARDGAEILVCPAQWPSPRANHWRALAIGRAVENQCYVIACNRTGRSNIGRKKQDLLFPGNSLVVDPHGTVLAEGRGEPGLVGAAMDLGVVHEQRAKIPLQQDRQPNLYRIWADTSG